MKNPIRCLNGVFTNLYNCNNKINQILIFGFNYKTPTCFMHFLIAR